MNNLFLISIQKLHYVCDFFHSLLASDKHPSKEDIEAAFDGNICRCTGYRAILDAMKSFSVDKSTTSDIEVIGGFC